ncbi:MAG: class I SAM-dependent methyltransferase [Spirochaetota bacterium]
MENKGISFNGTLKSDKYSIPCTLHHASRFSIYIRFDSSWHIRDGERFTSLDLQIDDRTLNLGGCEFILETNPSGTNGRLIFLNDVFNFDVLFASRELLNLEKLSKDLYLILSQKERVSDAFKDYVSRVSFDMKVYKQFFDELDKSLAKEIKSIRDHVFLTIIGTEGKKFMDFFSDYISELESIIKNYSREEHEIHGFYLRKQLWDVIACSAFMLRSNLKPRGYVGDSETMEMIYENGFRGADTFSMILYKISIEHPAAQAVRNRRVLIPQVLRDVNNEFRKTVNGVFRFMSVACGPAFELNDIFKNEDDVKSFHCTLLDQDDEAIKDASEIIRDIEKKIGYKIHVSYLKDSVRTMLRTKDLSEEWGKFNYIYSMGLFDYLTPPVAKAVAEKLYSLLEPGGKLFVGNYHFRNRSRWFMEYWHDWVLYYRTEDEFMSLLKDTDAKDVNIIFEDTNSQMFLTATKA